MELVSLAFSLDCKILRFLGNNEAKELLLTDLSGTPYGSLQLDIQKAADNFPSSVSLKRAAAGDPTITSPAKAKQVKNSPSVNKAFKIAPTRQAVMAMSISYWIGSFSRSF